MVTSEQDSEGLSRDFDQLLQTRPNIAQLDLPLNLFVPRFDAYLSEICRRDGLDPNKVDLAQYSSAGLLGLLRWMRKYRYLGRNGHTVNILSYLLHFPASGVNLLWIPKNSCTSIKKALLQFEPEEKQAKILPNRFHETVEKAFKLDTQQFFRDKFGPLTVLIRHPAERLVSCYIDKFVNPVAKGRNFEPFVKPHIKRAQHVLGIEAAPQRSLRFSEFVDYIVGCPAWQLDAHWRPQADFLGDRLRPETTLVRSDNFGYFADRFGLEFSANRHNASSGKRFAPSQSVSGEFAEKLPADIDLDAIESYNQFLDAHLMNIVSTYYRKDDDLFQKAV